MDGQKIDDELLGTLTWSDDSSWWSAEVELKSGKRVGVNLMPEDDDSEASGLEHVLSFARSVLLRLREDETCYTRAAADHLLDLYNHTWSGDDEPIDAAQFVGRIRLDSITFYSVGLAEMYFDDGDLFAGHTVVLDVNESGEVDGASIGG